MNKIEYDKLEKYYNQILQMESLIPQLRPLSEFQTKRYMFYIRYIIRLSLARQNDDYEKIIGELEELVYEQEYLLQPHVYYNILMFLEKLLNKNSEKKKQQKEESDKISVLSEYDFAIEHIDYIFNDDDIVPNKKLVVLKDLFEAIKLDLQYGSFTSFLYKERVPQPGNIFPFEGENDAYEEKEYIDLAYVTVYSPVFNMKKYSDCPVQPFKYSLAEHKAIYYKGLNLLYIVDGKHHAMKTKMYNTGGKVLATTVNIDKHLGELYSDGKKWYRDEKTFDVADFRIPVLLYLYEKIKIMEKRILSCR